MHSPLTEPLRQLADSWRTATRTSRRRVAVAVVALVCVVALLVARRGTVAARAGAAGATGVAAIAAIAWGWIERRKLREPERIVSALARGVDRDRADKALRALSLVGRDDVPHAGGTSADLARLHVERAIAAIPSSRVLERAARRAAQLGAAALVVGVGVLGLALANAWSVLEGADVLFARKGEAPVTMQWLDAIDLRARPPDYLHQPEVREIEMTPLTLPYGTVVTLHGTPMHPGRRLMLSDGATEVPFVDDGAGGVVARCSLASSVTLRVVARFGAVVVSEPEALAIQSVPDLAPVVGLEGAPRQVLLVDETEDIPIKYVAMDDHGLREVHLVLRSGTREERRVLARLDGETRVDKGGHVLHLRDKFLQASHAPIEVRVEAKDNDPLTGPKWGASEAITIIPPDVGEAEARRLDALRKLRDALVDSLAWRLSHTPPADDAGRKALAADDAKRMETDAGLLTSTLGNAYAGIRVPPRVRAVIVAKQQRLRKAVDAQTRAPGADAHAGVVKAGERLTLVVDAVVRALGARDTRDAAKRLADVADDLAAGAQQSQAEDARGRGTVRMDAATVVLAGGGRQMKRLGSLGRDIGEIVDADLSRVKRAREPLDFFHAELAARDLAARLREPDPSFGAKGRTGRAGGESGGGRGTQDDEGEGGGGGPDDVEQASQAAEDLERLAQDHAGEIGKMDQALSGAQSDEEIERLKEEAKRHAEAVREAARELPRVGQGSDSWTSKGVAARELAEQMAQSLEQGRPDDAAQSGRSSMGSLDEAKRMLQKNGWLEDPTGEDGRKVDDARRKLEAEAKWAEEQTKALRRRAAERARRQLEEGGGDEEKLAERARALGDKGKGNDSLPQQATESIDEAERAMRAAAEALKAGDAEKGMTKQREAQRELERAKEQLRGEEGDDGNARENESPEGAASRERVDVPKNHAGPDEFRRRVVRGLGQPSGASMKDAVHRYAEGLLR